MAGEFGRQFWSGAVREAFLRGLAAHGSVRRACRETGMSVAGAYGVRKRDADFARLWEKAVARAGAERVARLSGAAARAEPIALRFESGRAFFAGSFPELEDELSGLTAGGGYEGPSRSPDRADAMVWAMTELSETRSGVPRVRRL